MTAYDSAIFERLLVDNEEFMLTGPDYPYFVSMCFFLVPFVNVVFC